jgi:peptide/nickel transport system substrate-binding protein
LKAGLRRIFKRRKKSVSGVLRPFDFLENELEYKGVRIILLHNRMGVKFLSGFFSYIFLMSLSQTLLASELETFKDSSSILPSHIVSQKKFARDSHYGGTLIWGVVNAPTAINPIITQHSVSASLLELIFDSLVRIDDQGEVVSGLAESWDITNDGLEIIFHLHKGVRFHDGEELTSEDVKFTYDQIADPVNQSPWRSGTLLTDRWEIIDRYTVRLILKEPFVPILHRLTREIAPKHLLADEDIHNTIFNKAPVGTGPFKFQSWDGNMNEIELVANEDYFEGRPNLDKILIKVFRDNSYLWAALLRREVDLVQYISEENYEVLKKDSTFKTYAVNWGMCLAILYNLKDSIFSDRSVRLAIAHGVNVPEILSSLSEVHGVVSTGPFPPDSPGFNPKVKLFEFNPALAKQILNQQGWKDIAGNGIVERNGRELELKLLVDARSQALKKIAKIIRQQMDEIGIKVTVVLYQDESELLGNTILDQKPNAWLRYFSGPDLGGYEIARDWYSESTEFLKIWQYSNKKVDKLFQQVRSTKDTAQMAKYYQQIHKYIYEDQPACFLFVPTGYAAINKNFQNTGSFFNKYNRTYTLKKWFLK